MYQHGNFWLRRRSLCAHHQLLIKPVMLNYASEYCKYGEYCDARQAAVTVIRSSDADLKSCLEWLTMSYIISDSAYLISV